MVIEALPVVQLTMDAYVDGEPDLIVGDVLTVKVRVDYVNLKKGE